MKMDSVERCLNSFVTPKVFKRWSQRIWKISRGPLLPLGGYWWKKLVRTEAKNYSGSLSFVQEFNSFQAAVFVSLFICLSISWCFFVSVVNSKPVFGLVVTLTWDFIFCAGLILLFLSSFDHFQHPSLLFSLHLN